MTRVVSFAYGERYYHDAAERLRADCERLGVACHVERLEPQVELDWAAACRYKIQFLAGCRERFRGPLWWVDVDCRLLRPPPDLGEADLAFFLRGFRSLVGFDPMALPRFMQPSILRLADSPGAHRFLANAASRDAQVSQPITDDWLLHEAWLQEGSSLSTTIMPPHWIRGQTADDAQAIFEFGSSGNVGQFKDQVLQHPVELYTPARRKSVFMREVSEALREGRGQEARQFLRHAQRIDPADLALAWRVARGWLQEGRPEEAEAVLKSVPPSPEAGDPLARFRLDMALDGKQLPQARRMAEQLMRGLHAGDAQWAEGRMLRIGLEERAKAQRLRDEQRPQLWWMEGPYPGNFGDLLNPYLVEKLTGLPPRLAAKGVGALVIGSTIRFAQAGTAVWGTGTPRLTDRLHPEARYLAVRGPATAALVGQSGGRVPAVLGDPGALLPLVYRPRQGLPRHRLGLVLHHAHADAVSVDDDTLVIPTLRAGYAGIEAFIDELNQCERILSTSLHGLIVAHAYGIPAQWLAISGDARVPGDGTKFTDYLASVGLEDYECRVVAPGSRIGAHTPAQATLPRKPIDSQALLDVSPWPLQGLPRR